MSEQPTETGALPDGFRSPGRGTGHQVPAEPGMQLSAMEVLPVDTAANGGGLSEARLQELREAYDTACNRGCSCGPAPQRLAIRFRNESESSYLP